MAYKFQSGESIMSGNLKQEGTISGSGDVTLAVGKDFNIAGSNVLNLTTLGSTVVGSSLTSVGTLAGLTASSPISANGGLEAGYVTSHGDISGSGDLTLGVAIDIDGSQVLSKATLGSTVLASSLTSVGTLVGVTSSQPIVASAGVRTAGVISGSVGISGSSAKFSGIVNAGRFVGNGAGITGITADTVDVTSSTVASTGYELVYTEYLGSDVGLGGTAGLAYYPNNEGSALIMSGTYEGFQSSQLLFGGGGASAKLAISCDDEAVHFKSPYQVTISGSNADGITLKTGEAANAGVFIDGTAGLKGMNAAGNGTNWTISQAGVVSASSDLRLGAGAGIDIGGAANVLQAASLGSTVLASSLTSVGALNGGSISSGFGAIDNGTSNITTGGKLVIDVDGTAINAAGAITLGAGSDAAMYWDGGSLVLDTAAASDIAFEVAGTEVASLDADGLSLAAGDAYQIGGTSVLNATTLGSAVVASSLTSVGTLTGVTSSRPIVAQQGLRVSGGVISGSTGISGSSAKFSGIVNGGRFVGSGAGLTNITADQTDVTSSTGDISYELAFTEYLGSDVGLGGNAGLAFNPKGLVSQFSSSLIVSGNNGGLPQARLVMGDKDAATLSIGAEAGSMLYKMYSSDASIRISGSHAGGVVLYGGDHAQAGTMVYGGQGLKILNAAGNDANAFISQAGLFSGSNIELDPGAEVKISGVKVLDQTTLGSTVLASSLTSVGTLSSLAVGNVTSTGILSASGDLRLGAGAGIDIGGQANVLSQATLGSTVLASSLTSLGTLNGMTSSMGVKVGGYGLFANDLTRSSGDLNIKLHDAAANHAGFRLANGGFPLKVLSTGVTELNNGEVKVGSSTGTVSGSGQLQFAGAAALNGTLSVNGAITLSGASDTAVAVGSDSIYFRDADGTMKRDTIADLVSAMAGTGLSAASGQLSLSSVGTPNGVGNANATLAEGLNYGTTTLTANRTWTLPASSGLSTGDVIRIKAPADVDTFYIKVTGSGAQKVDGGNPIVYLESDNAAIALHYVATNKFVIF